MGYGLGVDGAKHQKIDLQRGETLLSDPSVIVARLDERANEEITLDFQAQNG